MSIRPYFGQADIAVASNQLAQTTRFRAFTRQDARPARNSAHPCAGQQAQNWTPGREQIITAIFDDGPFEANRHNHAVMLAHLQGGQDGTGGQALPQGHG
jgi:hypothetical protein